MVMERLQLMKIVQVTRLIDDGVFSHSPNWLVIEAMLLEAVKRVHWPLGSGSFTLHPERGKERGQGNGVGPIKHTWQQYLKEQGWKLEVPFRFDEPANTLGVPSRKPGKMDAVLEIEGGLFCAEWETGNISSSHRAINKLILGMLKGILMGGALVVPSRMMYPYLTDRISNYAELEPYLPVWQATQVSKGLLIIIEIEHDQLDSSVARIPKGRSGRARE